MLNLLFLTKSKQKNDRKDREMTTGFALSLDLIEPPKKRKIPISLSKGVLMKRFIESVETGEHLILPSKSMFMCFVTYQKNLEY